jgi:hypothetical protein
MVLPRVSIRSLGRRPLVFLVLLAAGLGWFPVVGEAQDAEELFRTVSPAKVSPAVVVIRARAGPSTPGGARDLHRIGSGVLVSADGKVGGIAIKRAADIPRIRQQIGAMRTGQLLKASVLRAGQVIELTGKAP